MIFLRNIFLVVFCLGFLVSCSDEDLKINGETYKFDRQEEIDWIIGRKTSNGIEQIDGSNLDSSSIFKKQVAYMIWDTIIAYEDLDFRNFEFTILEGESIEIYRRDSMTSDTLTYGLVDEKYILIDSEFQGFSWESEELVLDFSIVTTRRGFLFNTKELGVSREDELNSELSSPIYTIGDTASALYLRYYFTR